MGSSWDLKTERSGPWSRFPGSRPLPLQCAPLQYKFLSSKLKGAALPLIFFWKEKKGKRLERRQGGWYNKHNKSNFKLSLKINDVFIEPVWEGRLCDLPLWYNKHNRRNFRPLAQNKRWVWKAGVRGPICGLYIENASRKEMDWNGTMAAKGSDLFFWR